MNTVFNEDIIFFLDKRVENNSVDLIIADPPYNILKIEWDNFNSEKEYMEFMISWLEKSYQKLKDTGTFYLFNNAYNSAKLIPILERIGFNFIDWITWYKKDGFNGCKNKYVNNQETILFLSKSKKWKFNADSIRVAYLSTDRMKHATKKGILKNGKRWFPNKNGKLCTNVWEFVSERHNNKINGKIIEGIHPTQKPIKMIERMILASSNENDLILDLFSGTGTTSFAAKNLNRNSLGCELNSEYYKYILKRLKGE
ncbi:site-specific DNA-methyltransferase [Spiroplasma sp. AdecLV25b]|uniref:DNA-methyltransferase n=1 Tax=Spiroplasma sp. AdecLV25b TaxID=3027162 RepID=UPI0027E02920|nr:site-specific DNA-methyltransferase [Spiroplasma sp. AdecLV25b]